MYVGHKYYSDIVVQMTTAVIHVFGTISMIGPRYLELKS